MGTGLRRRRILQVGAAAALVSAALALPHLLTASWLRYERHAWTRADPDAAARLERERPAGANETALRLTELARPLGIELQAFRSSDPALAPATAFVEAERAADGDGEAGATAALHELLARHDGALRAVEEWLVTSEPPAWPHDFRRAYDTRPPPVLGLRPLNALLLARAADRARAGDRAGADQALVASSRLDDGVRDRPEAITQLAAVALAVERAGVLRRLTSPPAGWTRHMGEHDGRSSFLASCLMDARLSAEFARSRAQPVPTGFYARLTAADASRRLRRLAGAVGTIDPCRGDVDALVDAPAWSAEARRLLPQAAQRWVAVRGADLEGEMTRVVLETRAQPPMTPDARPSRVCGGLVWSRTPDGAGGTVVAASGVTLPLRPRGASWRYHVKPAPAVAHRGRDR